MGTRRRIATLALLLTAAGALAGLARAEIVQSGNVRVNFHAGFAPKSLPRERPAPISVEVDGQISTTDGSNPPPLRELLVELNRAGKLETRGLPVCPTPLLQSTSSTAALEHCRRALVGKGTFQALLPLANQLLVNGRALVFNSSVHGAPGMAIHIYISAPVRLTLIIPIQISHQEGQFGTVLKTKVPLLAGGAASVTELKLKIGRRYTVHGERRSYLSAACSAPAGYPGAVFAFARGTFGFGGGREMHTVLSRDCQVRK
jgi:hypothetical protein